MKVSEPAHYLVTGASGFVGRALCRFLQARGDSVRALIRHPAKGPWDEAHICDLSALNPPGSAMEGIDGVFHLAGIAHVQDVAGIPNTVYRRVNLEATKALIDTARHHGVGRFVYFSSVKAAADPGKHCVDESWNPPPADAYGLSKRAAEKYVAAAGKARGMHVCNLRPCLVYGPGVKGNLARMIKAIDRGSFPPLPEFSNQRSMVGLDDLVEAGCLAMTNPKARGQTYIVTDGVAYSTRSLYLAISHALGKSVPRWVIPPPILQAAALGGDFLARIIHQPMPMSTEVLKRLRGWACYRSDRIRNELGWMPRQTFADVLPDIASGIGQE